MVAQITEYTSAQALTETLEKELAVTKSVLGKNLQRLDEINALAEKSRKVREVVLKVAGKEDQNENQNELTIGPLKIVLDATYFHESTVVEKVVRSHQERLLVLEKVRDALKWLDQLGNAEGLKYLVLEEEGIPQRILFSIL
jgi:hypothetical protein